MTLSTPDLPQWKTMTEWRAPDGPKNGTMLLVLLRDTTRMVAEYDGWCQRWKGHTGEYIDRQNSPVAWAEIPAVPGELIERNKFVKKAREHLTALEASQLSAAVSP